ncbi:hypothetical protein O4216_01090 [Rhodococcus erythropolis]|nr:hypothetical protein [Rhodococcus erythropolis]
MLAQFLRDPIVSPMNCRSGLPPEIESCQSALLFSACGDPFADVATGLGCATQPDCNGRPRPTNRIPDVRDGRNEDGTRRTTGGHPGDLHGPGQVRLHPTCMAIQGRRIGRRFGDVGRLVDARQLQFPHQECCLRVPNRHNCRLDVVHRENCITEQFVVD